MLLRNPMKEPARLIIPLWGEAYANKLVTMALAPLVRLAKTLSRRRDASIFEGTWTSLMMVFTVGRRLGCSALSEPTERC